MIKKRGIILLGIIICLIVMLFSSTVFSTTIIEKNTTITNEQIKATTGINNAAYFGEIWSLNTENSCGSADLNLNKEVTSTWYTEDEKANGNIEMTFASFITNRTNSELSNYRLSSYKVVIHDGPSNSDPVLYEGQKEVLENANDVIGKMIYPISIETKGKTNRTLAVEAYSETSLILDVLNVPVMGRNGQQHDTSTFNVQFQNPTQHKNTPDIKPQPSIYQNRSEITIDLGSIRLYSTTNRSKTPIIDLGQVNRTQFFTLNRSELPYTVTVTADYIVDLKAVPDSSVLSKVFGVKAEMDLEGGYNTRNRTVTIDSHLESFNLDALNLNRSGMLNRTMTLTEEPEELVFMISCNLLSSTPAWDIAVRADDVQSFESQLCMIKLTFV